MSLCGCVVSFSEAEHERESSEAIIVFCHAYVYSRRSLRMGLFRLIVLLLLVFLFSSALLLRLYIHRVFQPNVVFYMHSDTFGSYIHTGVVAQTCLYACALVHLVSNCLCTLNRLHRFSNNLNFNESRTTVTQALKLYISAYSAQSEFKRTKNFFSFFRTTSEMF